MFRLDVFRISFDVNKAAILRAIIDALRAEFDNLRSTSQKTRAAGNDTESKAEGKYDTRSTEDNYLADGLVRQAHGAAQAGAAYEDFTPPRFGPDSRINLGALVALAVVIFATTVHAQTYTLGMSALTEGPAAGEDAVTLTVAPATAEWTAVANDPWLRVKKGSADGTGSATVFLSFDANTGATRTGSFAIAGQTLTITQAGSTYVGAGLTTLVVAPLAAPENVALDGSGNIYIADTGHDAIKEYNPVTQSLTTLVSTGLNGPTGVALDGSGNVYIADAGNNAIKEYMPVTGGVATLVSTGLTTPESVALDGSGNVYIADTYDNAIKEYTAATQSLSTLVSTGLIAPAGVAVDGSGNVFIADSDDNALKEYKPSTQMVITLVSTGLHFPTSIAVAAGKVYIADTENAAIEEYTLATQTITTPVSSGLGQPVGVAVDGSGNLFIADDGALKEFTETTRALTTLIPRGLQNAYGVALDGSGNVYFADANTGALEEYMGATQDVATLIPSGLAAPIGVAVDGSGNVYIAQSGSNDIEEYTAGTQSLTTPVAVGLENPTGLAVDGSGNVYIADTGSNAIKEYTAAAGQVTTLVSKGLYAPEGVALDGLGNVYIADTGSNAVKKYIAATGRTSTLVSKDLGTPEGVAVDRVGNVYIANTGSSAIDQYTAASGKVTLLVSTGSRYPGGLAVDGSGNVYVADNGGLYSPVTSAIEEMPRAFIDPTNRSEPDSSGTDALPMVVPATTNLTGLFAPTSDQRWLTIGTVTGGVVEFSFTANPGPPRTAYITLLGQPIAITQGVVPPAAGKYTLLLGPMDTSPLVPQGIGYATLTVGEKGGVVMAGKLPDGESFTVTTSILAPGTADCRFSFDETLQYPSILLYKATGSLTGTLAFESGTDADLAGTFTWNKPQQVKGDYPMAFKTNLDVIGSRYLPAAKGSSVLPGFTSGTLMLSDTGALMVSGSTPLDQGVALASSNILVLTDPVRDQLKVTINPSTGVFKGAFLYPIPGRKPKLTDFEGLLFQDQTLGGGFFLGPNGSGRVSLSP